MSMHAYVSSYRRSEYTRLVCQYVEDTKSRGHTTKPRTQTVNSTLTSLVMKGAYFQKFTILRDCYRLAFMSQLQHIELRLTGQKGFLIRRIIILLFE